MHPDTLRLIADPAVLTAIKQHAISEFPREACGAILPDGYRPLRNLHPDGEHYFDCSRQLEPFQLSGDLIAVVHSHPNGPEGPSAADQEQQRAFGVPWGLCMCNHEVCSTPFFWGDMLEPPPLLGRQFRHGPSGTDGKGDCGALIRDWYRINRGIILPDFARDDNWWLKGEHHYLLNYEKAGFVRADMKDPQEGDVALIQFGPKVTTANHAAIYVGGGQIMHHRAAKFSAITPFVGWTKMVRVWLRYAYS